MALMALATFGEEKPELTVAAPMHLQPPKIRPKAKELGARDSKKAANEQAHVISTDWRAPSFRSGLLRLAQS